MVERAHNRRGSTLIPRNFRQLHGLFPNTRVLQQPLARSLRIKSFFGSRIGIYEVSCRLNGRLNSHSESEFGERSAPGWMKVDFCDSRERQTKRIRASKCNVIDVSRRCGLELNLRCWSGTLDMCSHRERAVQPPLIALRFIRPHVAAGLVLLVGTRHLDRVFVALL